jgi:hypothetical protein
MSRVPCIGTCMSPRNLVAFIWKDKKSVLFISTHAKPIVLVGEESLAVACRNGENRPLINTSPVHLECTNNMWGVDVADHVRSNYSCLVRTRKW